MSEKIAPYGPGSNKRPLFQEALKKEPFSAEELLAQARKFIPLLIPEIPDRRIKDLPGERTLRYYLSRGIISPPSGKKGVRSYFKKIHLLQILAVKKLQFQGFNLKKIGEILRGLEEREIEEIVLPRPKPIESKLFIIDEKPLVKFMEVSTPLAFSIKMEKAKKSYPTPSAEKWLRVRLNSGIELQVRGDSFLGKNKSKLEKFTTHLRIFLKEIKKESLSPY